MRRLVKSAISRLPFRDRLYPLLRRARLPESIYRHLHFTGPITVLGGRDGSSFRMWHWGNQVENDLFWAGFGVNWEAQSLRLWQALCVDAKSIVDLGANTGVYALSAASVNPHARVLAIEPVQRIFDKLRRNVELNGYKIATDSRAASDKPGTAVLFDPLGAHAYSASLDAKMLPEATTTQVEITVARLEDMLQEHGFPSLDLIKIDVERHEPQALDGMGSILGRDRPTLLIEILDAEIGRLVEDRIQGLGYLIYRVNETSGATREQTLSSAVGGRNYLLCQEPVAARLRTLGLLDQ